MKKNIAIPVLIIIALVLLMTGRYLVYGVPHEFLGPEYKGTFEGDYDFTLEVAENLSSRQMVSLWSYTDSAPAFVFAANPHVVGGALLYLVTHNLALAIKIYQVLFFILAGVSMFLLANYLYKRRLAALFAAILYTFTPFFIGEMLSYLHYSATYFCMPLAFLFIFKAMDSPSYVRFTLGAALVIAYNFLAHPQNVFIAGIFYALFSLRMIFMPGVAFKKRIKIFSVIFCAVLLLSAFFILPTLIDGHPYTRSLEGAGTWLSPANNAVDAHSRSHSQSLISAVTMFHWPWFITPLKSGFYPPIAYMLIFAIPFFLALSGAKSGLRDKKIKGWVIIFIYLGLLSFLISLGTRLGPLSPYSLAHRYIPYFHMARAPYRYFYQAALSICLLAGLVVFRLPKIKAIALFLLVTVPYLYAANFYGNHYNWTFIPSEEPRFFAQTQNWLLENNRDRFRVVECFGTPTNLGVGQRMFPNGLDLTLKAIDKPYLDKYLSLFGIKYILAPRLHCRRDTTFDQYGYMPPRADDGPDQEDDNEEYYSAWTTEFRFITDRLEPDTAFSMHTAETKDVAIFENKTAFEPYSLYPARGILLLGGVNAYDFLELKRYRDFFKKGNAQRLAPIFIAQQKNFRQLSALAKASDELILHNTDMFDLFLLMNPEYRISLSSLKDPGWVFAGGSSGVLQPVPALDHSLGNFLFGDLAFSDFSLASDKQGAVLNVPFTIDKQGRYAIFLRAFGAEGFGSLSVCLDGAETSALDTALFRGFHWFEFWVADLREGSHSLAITTNKAAPVFLDSAAILPEAQLDKGIQQAREYFKDMPLSYIIGANNILRQGSMAVAELFIDEPTACEAVLRMNAQADADIRGQIGLEVDSRPAASGFCELSAGRAVNVGLGGINFSKGRHIITLKNIPAGTILDLIAFSMLETKNMPERSNKVSVNYKIDRFKNYRGSIRADRPFILVHTEANYPGWAMRLGSRSIEPVVTNMFLNGFIVDCPAKSSFKVYYLNKAQALGLIISGISLLVVIFLIIRKSKK